MVALTAQEIDHYHRKGFVIGHGVLDETALATLHREVDRIIGGLAPGDRSENLRNLHEQSDFVLDLCLSRTLLDPVESLLGPDLVLVGTYAIAKTPRRGLDVRWHQDAQYFPLEPMEVTTLWLAVDDSNLGNGCMQVVPGSHRERVIHDHTYSDAWGRETTLPLSLVNEASAPRVPIELPAGTFSLHDPYIVHGSGPNHSAQRRCGITVLYMTNRVRIDPAYKSPMELDWNTIRLYRCRNNPERGYHYPTRAPVTRLSSVWHDGAPWSRCGTRRP